MSGGVPCPELAAAIAAAWPAGGARPAVEGWLRCDSTMERARAWHARDRLDHAAVVSLEQTEGRGRRGRRFVSPPGGLYLTAILPAPAHLEHAFRIGLAAAVAARRAVAALRGPEIAFEWPNDLVVGRGKVGGILSELVAGPGQPGPPVVLVGVGLNVGPDPGSVDPRHAGPAARLEMPPGSAIPALAATLLAEIDALHGVLDDERRWQDVLERLERGLAGLRRRVELRRADGTLVSGTMLGIARDGALRVLRADGREVCVRYGEPVRDLPTRGG